MTYEQQLLGAIIKTPRYFKEVALELKAGDLALESHKKIYNTIKQMFADDEWVDFISLKDRINDKKINEEISHMLVGATEMDQNELISLTWKVKEEAIKYKLQRVGSALTSDETYKGVPIKDVISTANKRIFEIGEDRQKIEMSSGEVVDEMLLEREMFKGKKMWGYPTGFPKLDSATKGIQKGHTWVVGAYTSGGKSWFCMKFANEAHKEGAKVLFLSTEMIEKRLAWRYVTINSGLNEYDMISGSLSPESEIRMNDSLDRLKNGSLKLISGITDVDEIIFYVKREVSKGNCDLVVVDFLQNLRSGDGHTEYERMTDGIVRLQMLALRENVAMIVASQVNRESFKSKSSMAFGYKGSGAIEQAADVGIVLKTQEDDITVVDLEVRKNRNGKTEALKVDVDFALGKMEEQ